MRKRNIAYILMCLLVCSLFTACGGPVQEKTSTEGQTVNIEETQEDAGAKEDTSAELKSDKEEEAADVEEVKNVEDDSDDEEYTQEYFDKEYSVYNNPIDEYYIPIIYSWETSQVEIRAAQDAYRKVWKQEFKNLMKWLKKKCIYEEDRENIIALEKNVAKQARVQRKVCEVELLNGYKVPFAGSGDGGETRLSLPGNGTRSGLNQMEGEIYRDASMRILLRSSGYKFRKIDYSKVAEELRW